MIEEFAAAKINLTLEIAGRRSDGYHELASLVAFARDAGDHLTLTPGPVLSFTTTGPEATAIEGTNLVTKAVETALEAFPDLAVGSFVLDKNLPVASGIGGGSADAAAALRALARINSIDDPSEAFSQLASNIGADVPVCVGGNGCAAAFMSGIGEKVWRPASGNLLPPGGLAALLVNPRVAVSTGAVFNALAAPLLRGQPSTAHPSPFATLDDCLAYIASSRNDLEAPAIALQPVIAEVLGALHDLPGCRLARMSGSGATCFALFEHADEAAHAARAVKSTHPAWWIAATRLQ